MRYMAGLLRKNMSSTAIVFPPKGSKLKQGTEEPLVYENVAWLHQIHNYRPRSYVHFQGKWYYAQPAQYHSLFNQASLSAFREVPEALVPKDYLAWTLILT